MRAFISFVTTPTADTPGTALWMHFDDRRYIFGRVAEGTQRAMAELGTKLVKVSNVFLTGPVQWSTAGGLFGLLMTIGDVQHLAKYSATAFEAERQLKQEQRQGSGESLAHGGDQTGPNVARYVGVPDRYRDVSIQVCGGKNLGHVLASSRYFSSGKGVLADVHEFPEREGRGASGHARAGTGPVEASEKAGDTARHGAATSPSAQSWPPTWSDDKIKVWVLGIDPQPPESPRGPGKRPLAEHERDSETSSTERSHPERDGKIRRAAPSTLGNSRHEAEAPSPTAPQAASAVTEGAREGEEVAGQIPSGRFAGEAGSTNDSDMPRPAASDDTPSFESRLPPTSPSERSISYIVKTHPQRGVFLADKATALLVKPGPDRRKLTLGKSVTAEDGTTVTPAMVMGDPKPGSGVAIVDLPTASYVPDLVGRPEWGSSEVMDGVEAIIWILGPGVSQDPRLLSFIKARPLLRHLVSSPDHCPNYLPFALAGALAKKHHCLSDTHFPVPVHNNTPVLASAPDGPWAPFEAAQPGLTVQLAPTFEMQRTHVVPPLDLAAVALGPTDEPLRYAEGAKKLIQEQSLETSKRPRQPLPGHDAEVITLGTGSMLPSSHRNVSGTLLRVPGCGTYLFDCGENTLGQLRRVFSPEELSKVFDDLRAIWISHHHADHCLGVIAVLKAWSQATAEKDPGKAATSVGRQKLLATGRGGPAVYVLAPSSIFKFLEEHSNVEYYGYDRVRPLVVRPADRDYGLYDTSEFHGYKRYIQENETSGRLTAKTALAMGVEDIQTVQVDHCRRAQAVSFLFRDGFKFSFSGDCRPSKKFVDIGMDSTVLVHEATFDDPLQQDAIFKKHCTTTEALSVAMAMRARRVILTHFSQRYPRLPVFQPILAAKQSTEDTAAASAPVSAASLQDEPMSGVGNDAAAATKDNGQARSSEEIVATGKAEAGNRTDMRVVVAFDYMRVKVGEIGDLENFSQALSKLFEIEEEEKMAEKEAKRVADLAAEAKRAAGLRKPASFDQQHAMRRAEKEAKWVAKRARRDARPAASVKGVVTAAATESRGTGSMKENLA